jgi:hypothetical protein
VLGSLRLVLALLPLTHESLKLLQSVASGITAGLLTREVKRASATPNFIDHHDILHLITIELFLDYYS